MTIKDNVDATELFLKNNNCDIDLFIEYLRSSDDRNFWCQSFIAFRNIVDSRTFMEGLVQFAMTFSMEPSEHHIANTKINLILELFEKIKLQDNIYLTTFCITGCAPIRYYVMKEYNDLKRHYNSIIQRNCFTNLHIFRIYNEP